MEALMGVELRALSSSSSSASESSSSSRGIRGGSESSSGKSSLLCMEWVDSSSSLTSSTRGLRRSSGGCKFILEMEMNLGIEEGRFVEVRVGNVGGGGVL